MSIYEAIYYGAGGSFYGPSDTDVPTTLSFYRTNVDNVYVFHWGFQEAFISPILSTLDFDLQLDTSPTFDSVNLMAYDSSNVINYQNGDVRKGFAVDVSARQDKTTQTWYARVRSKTVSSFSAWSLILQFVILEKFQLEEAEALLNNLPDYHVYNKEDLLKAVSDRSTKLYHVCDMYGKELDQTKLENILTSTNNYISLCRDEQLYDNFGVLFDYVKPQTQEFVEYRDCLRALILGSLVGGTFSSVRQVSRSLTGVSAVFLLIRDRDDFFSSTTFEVPPETPDGVITFFTTSSDYKPFSLQVLQNGMLLTPGVDFVEDHVGPVFGFTMTVAPLLGDTIQVFFDLGAAGDPEPVIFDITNTTTLTGATTFTNGSKTVTGVGTLYTSELQEGNLIADDSGYMFGLVKTIIDDTNLLLNDEWTGSTGSNSSAKRINFNGTIHLTGDVTFTNGSTAVSAIGGSFTTELVAGSSITDNAGTTSGIVQSITDDDNLTLTANWGGATGSNINARELVYEDATLWGQAALSHGVIIKIRNPGQFALDEELIKKLLTPLVPAHVRVFFEFE